jgi:putative transposase
LGKEQSISEICRWIKGESSHWINKNIVRPGDFAWQDDYFAVSIGESQVDAVVGYIRNQERHHAKTSFTKEVDVFMQKYGFQSHSSHPFHPSAEADGNEIKAFLR